jgi:ketosteroid isomerase-like protein
MYRLLTEDGSAGRTPVADEAEKRVVVDKFLEGLCEGDWSLIKSVMAEDIVWSLPGRNLISGEVRGIEAVVQRAQLISSYGLHFRLIYMLIGQRGIALSLKNTASRGRLFLNEHFSLVCHFRDGKIAAIDTFLSNVAMANAFFV